MLDWEKDDWIASSAKNAQHELWRAVEAQHLVATMSLVDTLDEQFLLEELLEASKPPVPKGTEKMDYLIFTPFRYTSPHPSRFRRANDPGVWYGAFDRQTACAEVGYWRWRFLMDSKGLRDEDIKSDHTLFQARVSGRCIDLTRAPWDAASELWRHPNDYGDCHSLANHARTQKVDWIRYGSARHPEGTCGAVLTPQSLTIHEPTRREHWACRVTSTSVIFRHGNEGFSFDPSKA